MAEKILSNREFAEKDPQFKLACSGAAIPATPRQASKFRNKTGKAYKRYLLFKTKDGTN
jgi:hypothetical protein